MTKHTINRRSDVVTRVEGDETLVLDTTSNAAHCLSGDMATVWNATDGSLAQVASGTGLTIEAVAAAVAGLDELGLVVVPAGLSRRTLVTRGAALTGAAVAVSTISLPTAAMAASTGTITGGRGCTTDATGRATLTLTVPKFILSDTNYTVTVVYSSVDSMTTNNPTTYTVTYGIQTLSNGKPSSLVPPAPGGSDTLASNFVAATSGPDGVTGFTTGHPLTATPPLPANLQTTYGVPAGAATNGVTSGNVYAQFVPTSDSTKVSWYGYFNLPYCYTY